VKILVTGGAGFIGSHFAEQLLQEGHEVIVVDDLSRGTRANLPRGCAFHHLDLAGIDLPAFLATLRPEGLFHFSAQIDVGFSIHHVLEDARRNIMMTLALVEAAMAAGVGYFVFASSGGAIYGEASGPQDEEHPERPLTPYGVAKLSVDRYLDSLHRNLGLAYASMRFANVYGPRQTALGEAGVVPIFMGQLAAGQPLSIRGDGLQTRDFVHVADLARAGSLLLNTRPVGIFNFGSGQETRMLDLGQALSRASGRPAVFRHVPALTGEQRRSVLDASKAERVLGWRPAIGLEAGLQATYAAWTAGRTAR